MFNKGGNVEGTKFLLSTARIIHLQPIQLWTQTQPILRQALLSPVEKQNDQMLTLVDKCSSGTQSNSRKKTVSSTDLTDTIHLYPSASSTVETTPENMEYSADLLAGLSSSNLPTLTPSQLSCLLSDIDAPIQVKSMACNTENSSDVKGSAVEGLTSSKNNICMEKRHNGEKCWYICLRCDYICIDPESAFSHPGVCPGPITKISCIACSNSFKSSAVLKAHLLIDHGVSVEEHPGFIAMNIGNRHQDESTEVTVLQQPTETPGRTVIPREDFSLQGDSCSSNIRLSADQNNRHNTHEELTSESSSNPQKDGLPRTPRFSLFETVETLLEDDCGKGETTENTIEEQKDKDSDTGQTPAPKKSVKSEKITKLRCRRNGCTAKLASSSNMDYHQICHEGLGFKCPECSSEAYSTWSSLTIHLWRRHGMDMELYSCDQCSYKTNSLSKLMNLHRRTHGNERPFLCDLCGKGFKTTKQLRNHKAIHRQRKTTSENGSVDCETCGRTFACARLLRQHSEVVHRRLRPYLCPDCGHSAASRSSLRMHSRQHTGEKPYVCNVCDYSTPDHNTLRRHKMRHTGKRPYSCPHCSYKSIQSSTYKTHLKNKHPGLDEGLMYSCEICPFRTVKHDNFLAHTSHHALGTVDNDYGNITLPVNDTQPL